MKYDLVFEGGGAKGMALVGAYDAFVERGHSHGRLLGTSAGAITAALLAAGYTSEELLAALNEQVNGRSVFAGFMGTPALPTDQQLRSSLLRQILRDVDLRFLPGFIEERLDDTLLELLARDNRFAHVYGFVERGGWFADDRFLAWLNGKLDVGTWSGQPRGFSQMTLGQFFGATGTDVSFVASDTTGARLLVLNHNTAPDCPLLWAVRMSMSIPLVWAEVIWDPGWGQYLGRDITGQAVVDGGLLSNFPLELFISDAPYVVELMGPRQDIPVLGLLMDESIPVPTLAESRGLLVDVDIDPGELRTVQRLKRLANTATTARDKMVTEAYRDLVARLPARGYGTTEFDMSDQRRAALIEGGRLAMRQYLAARPEPDVAIRGLERAVAPTDEANRVARRLLDPDA